MYHIGHAKLLE